MSNESVTDSTSFVKPSVLFASCCSQDATLIVEKLLNGLSLPIYEDGCFKCFPWNINNKYYDADVNMIVLKSKSLVSTDWALTVQGVVLQFDSYDMNALHNIKSWYSYLQPYDAVIKILLCSKMDDSDPMCLRKLEAQKWCLQHGFELIELEPGVNDVWVEEQDFQDADGIITVKQALEAHFWPNLVLKERVIPKSMEELWHGGVIHSTVVE